MHDPFHVAKYIERILAKDRFEEALLTTRLASKDMTVVVSWNALIDYQLRHDRLRGALKLYNEMKKRTQLPNAQTYTIIFRGCAQSSHPQQAVSEAIKLYMSMMNLERLSPNTIHLNAVVKVCAKANDLDCMFSVLETANNSIRAPNNLTYTTILNALRAQIDRPQSRNLLDNEIKTDIEKTVARAKSIWEEVISRWKLGQVILDEELVCAMGRILLLQRHESVDCILDLIEQTMAISKAGRKEPNKLARYKLRKFINPPTDGPAVEPDPNIVPKTSAPGAPSGSYARPGNNSLSLILQSLERTGRTRQGIRYWGIFNKNYGVVPDGENWYRLARVFMRGKNSADAVGYLVNMPRELAAPQHFRVAMRTCLRDRINPAAFGHATRILEIMNADLAQPDLQSMRTYLRVAYACKRTFEAQSEAGEFEQARRAFASQLQEALDHLAPLYRAAAQNAEVDKLVLPGAEGDEHPRMWARLAHQRLELAALARKMIAAADRLIQEDLVAKEAAEPMKKMRNTLNRFVVAYYERRNKLAPEAAAQKQRHTQGDDEVDDRELKADEYDEEGERERSDYFLETGKMRKVPARPEWGKKKPSRSRTDNARKLSSVDELLLAKRRNDKKDKKAKRFKKA